MVDHNSQSSDGNSFVTGFTVGLFVGAAGYYLFATEKGTKLRKQLVAEWESATIDLVEEGVIESTDVSLRDFISGLLHKTFDIPETKAKKQVLMAEELEAGRKKAREVTNKAKKDAAKKFKGV